MIEITTVRLIVAGTLAIAIGFLIGARTGLQYAGWLIAHRAEELGMYDEVLAMFERLDYK